jgi:hypothetical protein
MNNDNNDATCISDVLHVYGQHCNHDTVKLVGTRRGLEALQRAINALISKSGDTKISSTFQTFANDGEGYKVIVEMVPAKQVDNMPAPYTHSINTGEPIDRSAFKKT